jgi:membrane-associated phospholipid phosphatase
MVPGRRLGDALTFVDKLYFVWFIGLTALILPFHSRIAGWQNYVIVHVIALSIVIWLALAVERSATARFLHDWYPLAFFIVCFEETARLSFLIVDSWRDPYILHFEAWAFGTPPTVWLDYFASRPFTELMEVGYFSYFLLLMIVGGSLYNRPGKSEFRQVMTASVLAYMVCYVFFILFPTEGPAHTLAHLHTTKLYGGPFHWLVLLIQNYAGVHGNAFPSSHVAEGMVTLIFAWRYRPKLGAVLTPFVFLLCCGAVYDRYHYASDVIAGLGVGVLCAGVVLASAKIQQSPELESEADVTCHSDAA